MPQNCATHRDRRLSNEKNPEAGSCRGLSDFKSFDIGYLRPLRWSHAQTSL